MGAADQDSIAEIVGEAVHYAEHHDERHDANRHTTDCDEGG
jgi:hypothetical protein